MSGYIDTRYVYSTYVRAYLVSEGILSIPVASLPEAEMLVSLHICNAPAETVVRRPVKDSVIPSWST